MQSLFEPQKILMGMPVAAQVVCAGVWHNAALCAACWALAFCLPWLLLPLYATGRGAVVRWVPFLPSSLHKPLDKACHDPEPGLQAIQ